MIHKTDDGSYVISSRSQWLPGYYVDERTAWYALWFSDAELLELNRRINKRAGRPITFSDLQNVRRNRTEAT